MPGMWGLMADFWGLLAMLKLNRHGIDGPLLQRFKHFLTNRMQRVVISSRQVFGLDVSKVRGAPRNNSWPYFVYHIHK